MRYNALNVRRALTLAAFMLAVVMLALATACNGGGEKTLGTLTMRATDFAFELDGAEDLKPGPITITMPNEGEFEHYALFFRVEGDHTVEEVIEALGALEEGGEFPEWAEWKGGPSILSPGEAAEINVNFPAGRYVYLCPLGEDDPDGVPHFEKGMLGEFTIEDEENTAELPAADIEVRGEDDGAGESYAFAGLPESVDAGEALVEFENVGSEPHEMVAARVPEKFTLEETLGVFLEEVEPPDDFEYVALGGPAPILPGDRQQLRINFQKGSRYVFVCFIPNQKGVPHVALGMSSQLNVR